MSLRGGSGTPPKAKGGGVPQDEVREEPGGRGGGGAGSGGRVATAGRRDARLGTGSERHGSAGTHRSSPGREGDGGVGGAGGAGGESPPTAREDTPGSALSYAICENYYTASDADRQLRAMHDKLGGGGGDRVFAAKEACVALNTWIPGGRGAGVVGKGQGDREAVLSRMAYVEAERRAAAADAAEFYEEMDRKREEERTCGNLASSEAVRDARLLPWTDGVARSLSGEGRSELVEAAVRRYEPPRISEDPNQRRQIEESWEATAAERLVKARGLVKEGWLWKLALTGLSAADATVVAAGAGKPFWCSLISHSGLSWSAEERGALCGLMNWEAISKVEMSKFLPGTFSIEGEAQKLPRGDILSGEPQPMARRLLFRSEDADVLKSWFSAVHLGFETFKMHRGGDFLRIVGEDSCEPGSTQTFKVPQIDVKFEDVNSKDRIVRNVVWFVKEGDKVIEGDVICTIERQLRQQPAEVLAPRSGVVVELFVQRTDPRTGDKYTRVGDNMIKIKIDAEWKTRYKFVKREEDRLDTNSSWTGSVVGHSPGTVLPRATSVRPPDTWTRPETRAEAAAIATIKESRRRLTSAGSSTSGSDVLAMAGTVIVEGRSGIDRGRAVGYSARKGASTLTPALFQQLVHKSAAEDATGFWQTAKLYSQPKRSADGEVASPSERHNHTVQTIRSRYSDKVLAAAASILNSSM